MAHHTEVIVHDISGAKRIIDRVCRHEAVPLFGQILSAESNPGFTLKLKLSLERNSISMRSRRFSARIDDFGIEALSVN